MEDKKNTIEVELQNDIKTKLDNIPEKMLKSFTKRAIRDAEKLFNTNDNKFNDIAYSIYRGYCIGFVMGNIDKISSK